MIRQFFSLKFLKFLLAGGASAACNFGSRILYSQWLDFSSAVVLAYLTGMFTAFLLFKLFVFKTSQQSPHRSVLFFVMVNLFGLLQTWGISMGLLHYLLPYYKITLFTHEIAHASGLIATTFTSFIGHKRWTFR